jgi:hypothetical protein
LHKGLEEKVEQVRLLQQIQKHGCKVHLHLWKKVQLGVPREKQLVELAHSFCGAWFSPPLQIFLGPPPMVPHWQALLTGFALKLKKRKVKELKLQFLCQHLPR